VALQTGETLDVVRVTCPDEEYRDRILPYLAHKGPDWAVPMREHLAGPLEGLAQHFYLGVVGDTIVGNASHVEGLEPPVAILQHVFVPPERRRLGICSTIIRALAEDFVARGGRVSYLHTGHQSPAYYIYESVGFAGYGETGIMGWMPDPSFATQHFRSRPTTVRDTLWQDWAPLEALYEVEEGWYLRSVYLRQWGRSGYEGQYIQLRLRMREGRVAQAKVLVAEDGGVMGHATLARDEFLHGDTWLLDFLVHPNHVGEALPLLEALDLDGSEKVQCYVDSAQPEKADLLQRRGFRREAHLSRQVRRGEEWLDLEVYAL
jgi:hypothetical protein